MKRPIVGFLVVLYFLATFCFACFETTFALLLNEKFSYDQTRVGYLFTYCGLLAAFIQGGAIGRLVKKLGERKLIASSLLIVAVSLAMLPYFPNLGGLLVGLGLFAAGSGVNRPPTFGLISLHTPESEQGATLGIAQSAGSLARIFGALFAPTMFYIQPSLPYLICAALALAAGLMAWKVLVRDAPPQTAA